MDIQEEIQEEVNHGLRRKMPKWLKILLLVVSVITLVYWIGFAVYKMLKAFRIIGAFVFEPRNYWTFLCCVLILAVGSLLVAQFFLDLNPFGKFANWCVQVFEYIRIAIADLIA